MFLYHVYFLGAIYFAVSGCFCKVDAHDKNNLTKFKSSR